MKSYEFAPGLIVAGISVPQPLRDFKLIAFDMDSTRINIKCVDEIADAVGRKVRVAAITEATMRAGGAAGQRTNLDTGRHAGQA